MKEDKPKHTELPWRWQKLGGKYYLVSATKWIPIVLGTLKGKITSLVDGLLVPFDPEHPNSKFIEEACNSHYKLKEEIDLLKRSMQVKNILIEGGEAKEKDLEEEIDKLKEKNERLREALKNILYMPKINWKGNGGLYTKANEALAQSAEEE